MNLERNYSSIKSVKQADNWEKNFSRNGVIKKSKNRSVGLPWSTKSHASPFACIRMRANREPNSNYNLIK